MSKSAPHSRWRRPHHLPFTMHSKLCFLNVTAFRGGHHIQRDARVHSFDAAVFEQVRLHHVLQLSAAFFVAAAFFCTPYLSFFSRLGELVVR